MENILRSYQVELQELKPKAELYKMLFELQANSHDFTYYYCKQKFRIVLEEYLKHCGDLPVNVLDYLYEHFDVTLKYVDGLKNENK